MSLKISGIWQGSRSRPGADPWFITNKLMEKIIFFSKKNE